MFAALWKEGSDQKRFSSIGTLLMRYDAEGRQVGVETTASAGSDAGTGIVAEYEYDADGRRVIKRAGSLTTYFVYDVAGQLAAEYDDAQPIAGTQYLVTDYLGSTRMVVDGNGACRSRMDYAPFGAEITRDSGWPCYGGSAGTTLKFTGKERDAETGLDYMDFRYYGGAQGRFLSPDPLMASANVGDPQSWNRYVYARNNPLKFTDPLGLFPSPAYNCSEGQSACLNDDQRRILENSKVKVGDKTLSGEALWNAVGKNAKEREAIQNVFVNVTDRLASISTGDGKNALNGVTSVTGLESDRIKANLSESVYGAVKGSSAFEPVSGALHPGFDFASFKSKDREANIQFSFAPPVTPGAVPRAADIDHDLFNDWRHGFEVIQNHVTGGKTNQDSIRQNLIKMPGVGITPSPDPKWNRR